MIKYLFDTNFCIAMLNKSLSPVALRRLDECLETGEEYCISSLVLHELWYGIAYSEQVARNTERLRRLLESPLEVLTFNAEDGRFAAEIRAELRRRGTPIGPYDLLIAGQALARDLVVVTRNTREFLRVDGLKLVDWS